MFNALQIAALQQPLMVNTEKENTMNLITWIKSLFKEVTHQDRLEQFVAGKNPQNTAEVEYWIRRYDTHHKEWAL